MAYEPVPDVSARWSLRLLGGFELATVAAGERAALPGKRERGLLAHLALSAGGRAARVKLAFLLWGEAGEDAALHNLRNCLSSVRKALGDTKHRLLSSDGDDIVLDLVAVEADALAFRRLAAEGSRAGLEAAARLYTGELLDGLTIDSEEFETWRRVEATRCRDLALDVLHRLVGVSMEEGDIEGAIEAGTRILALDPLHEAAARRLMQCYGRSGRRGAAIGVYRALCEGLQAEVGAQPEALTRAVFADIARGGDEPAAPAPVRVATKPHKAMAVSASAPSSPATVARSHTYRPVAIMAVALLTAMLAAFVYARVAPNAAAMLQSFVEARRATVVVPARLSIAVLPFDNLSGDPAQDFFSDGITEEITSTLTKMTNLQVVARSSAFEFKGRIGDIRGIGRALGATHLFEGSVR